MVLAVHLGAAVGIDVHILAGLLLVALLIPGFREDAGHAGLHLAVELVEERRSAVDHIVVVLEHELALHGEILRHLGELVALAHLLEQRDRLGELLADVVDVSLVVRARNRILRIRPGKDFREAFFSPLVAARTQVAVRLLEGEVGAAGLVEMVAVDGVVDRQGFGIMAGVEITGSQRLLDHRLLRGVGILVAEGVDQAFGIDLVQGDGAHHLVGLDFGAVQCPEGLLAQLGEGLFSRIVGTAVV